MPLVSRNRAFLNYLLIVAATATLFVVIIAVREHTALVSALSAAGTVAAGVFAALAALGSMRAAADSSATARRSREALARTAKPQVRPGVRADGGTLLGAVRADRVEPGPDPGLAVDLGLPPDADLSSAVKLVWLEYRDAGHLGQWQDTWEVAPSAQGTFRLTDSYLAD